MKTWVKFFRVSRFFVEQTKASPEKIFGVSTYLLIEEDEGPEKPSEQWARDWIEEHREIWSGDWVLGKVLVLTEEGMRREREAERRMIASRFRQE